jgi:hypothetical protein
MASAEFAPKDPGRVGWSATNLDGFCSLKYSAGPADARLDLVFMTPLRANYRSSGITFHVIRTPHDLVWPVRVFLGFDPNAAQIEVGAEASAHTFLLRGEAELILRHLRLGQDLHLTYSLTDGIERRITLDQVRFPQSVAMFEACAAHVA